MNKKSLAVLLLFFCFHGNGQSYHQFKKNQNNNSFVHSQVTLDVNNIKSFIWNTGVFNQDLSNSNSPGFYWPNNSFHTAIFTSGLCIGAYVNGELRIAAASYTGEYVPGYSSNGQFYTDSRFKFYIINKGDNYINNPDWLNWGQMVQFGAPFIDANHNGTYEYYADTPGVRGAARTIFICLTDGDSTVHTSSEGFGGGTRPLFAEVHLTAWAYDNPGYQDMQFLKWDVINKNINPWHGAYFSIFCDPDLGNAGDDYEGCDSLRNLGYCYNGSNMDGNGTGRTYGIDPPAIGIAFLNCNNSGKMNNFTYWGPEAGGVPVCEQDPVGATDAYNYMKGQKKDGTPYVIPFTNPPQTTLFGYSGDPELNSGWTDFQGRVQNCGGQLTGNTQIPVPPSDVRFVMSIGSDNMAMNPGDTQVVQICQLIARGTNNLNSVTKLKQLADVAKQLCENNFIIGITPISTEIPKSFELSQNYPNPFNPSTKIRFSVPLLSGEGVSRRDGVVSLKVDDALGREITTLVNEQLKPGIYSVDWNASNYPSGVYFYKLFTVSYSETKKMVLIK